MTVKNRKIFNLITIAILMVVFINILSLTNLSTIGGVYAASDTSDTADTTNEEKGLVPIVKDAVAQWYYIFRYFSIIAMLVVLIYLGIQLAITSIAADKAKYKRMLADWVIGFVIVFGIHYFMALILSLNESCLNLIKSVCDNLLDELALEFAADNGGAVNAVSLYETIRTRAYEFRIGIGTSGMVMYMVLVYYTIRFAIVYFKRFFTIMILTIIAPLVGLSYAFTKVMTGKAPVLSKWGGEYCFNVFLQSIHALVYTIFGTMGLALSAQSIAGFIVALLMFNFMLKADKIFRKIFKISGKLLDDNADKDMKENFAAVTAATASMKNIAKNDMVKGAASSLKRGVGTVTNAGMVAGFAARNAALKRNDSKLFDKKVESEKMASDLLDDKISEEKKAKIRAEKLELDEQIARMESRRKRMDKYTEPIQSNSEVGKFIDSKGQAKRDAKVEKEYQRRLKARSGLAVMTEEEQKKLRQQVEREINRQVKRRNVYTDERTGQKEVIDGVGYQLSKEISRAIFGNDAMKNATKNMVTDTANAIAGRAMMIAAIPLTVANPMVGLSMLGKGMQKSKNKNKVSSSANFYQRRTLSKGARKRAKNQKYTFNRFSPGAINTLQAKQRRDGAANMVRHINTPSISMRLFTMPLRLTGAAGVMRTIAQNQYTLESASKKYYEAQEAGYAVARKDSINSDFVHSYRNAVKLIDDKYMGETQEGRILQRKEAVGNVFAVNGNTFQFENSNIASLTDDDLIDNAILAIAEMNNIVDLNELNISNKIIQEQLIDQLERQGVHVDETSEGIRELIGDLETRRKELVETKPTLAKEKLTQAVVIEYMQEKGIDNPDDIDKAEIGKRVAERIEEGKELTEEEKMQIEIEKIVEKAYEAASSPEERTSQIQAGIKTLFTKQEKESKSRGITEVLDELLNVKKDKTETIIETEAIIDTKTEKKIERTVERKTEKLFESSTIEDIIENIETRKEAGKFKSHEEEQAETDGILASVLSSVKKVEGKPTYTKEEQEAIDSSDGPTLEEAREKRNKEIEDLNKIIKEFSSVESVDEITPEFRTEHPTGQYGDIVEMLIASMEEDKVLTELKINKPDDKRRLHMKQSDEVTAKKTYEIENIEELVKSVQGRKQYI